MNFNINRFIALLKRDLFLNKKTIFLLIGALFIVGIITLFLVGDEIRDGVVPDDAGEIVFLVMLVLCGTVFTASIFSEFRKVETRIEYLTLPASTFEKWLSKWVYSLPLYIMLTCVLFSIVYIVFSPLVISIIWSDFGEARFVEFSKLRFEYFRFDILIYFILHSFIFLAAIIFNRYTLPKALLSYGLIILVSVFFLSLIYRLIYHEFFTGLFKEVKPIVYEMTIQEVLAKFNEKIPYLFACIGVPFIWLISYFKLKEKQI